MANKAEEQLEEYVNRVLKESNDRFDSYEVDTLTLAKDVVMSHPAISASTKGALIAKIDAKVSTIKGSLDTPGSPFGGYRSDEQNSVADFSITVKRLTNTINQSLPVPIFSPISAEGAYSEVVASLLGSGTTITSVLYGSNASFPDRMQITYANGGNSDIIEITCNTMHYPSFLLDCLNNRFIMSRARMSVSRVANALSQFSVTMLPFTQTLFGESRFNRISLGSNITPEQFQTGIIDVPKILPIEPNKGVIIPFVVSTNGDSFTLTGFVTANRRG